jgi:hypothetical protein
MALLLKPARIPLAAIEHPRCIRCSVRMALTKSEPRKDGFEKRMFECGKCHRGEIRMVADPLRSDRLTRIARSVAPPI